MKKVGAVLVAIIFGGLLPNAYAGGFAIKECGSFNISATHMVGMREKIFFEDSAVVVTNSEVLLFKAGKVDATRLPLKNAQATGFGAGFVTSADGTVIARDRFGKELKSWNGTALIVNQLQDASQPVLGIVKVESDKPTVVTLVKEEDFSAESFAVPEPIKDRCLLLSADKKSLLTYSISGIEWTSTIAEMLVLRDGKPKLDIAARYRGAQLLSVSTTGHFYLKLRNNPTTTIYCIDADGAEIWKKEIDDVMPIFKIAGSGVNGDRVLLASSDKAFQQSPGKMRLLLLDPKGDTLADLSEGSYNAPLVAPDQSCVFLTGKEDVMGADLKNGKMLWRKPTKETFENLDSRGGLAGGTATVDGIPVFVWLWREILPDGKFGNEIKIIVVNIATGDKTVFTEMGASDSAAVSPNGIVWITLTSGSTRCLKLQVRK